VRRPHPGAAQGIGALLFGLAPRDGLPQASPYRHGRRKRKPVNPGGIPAGRGMTWREGAVPDVRIVGFRMADRHDLLAFADVKIGEHIRLNGVRLIRIDDLYTVASPLRADGHGPNIRVATFSPDLRAAIAAVLLARYRKRLAATACIPAQIGA
jgi:hypothetical protein